MSEKKSKGGPGCLKLGFSMGCVAPVMFLIGIVVVIVVLVALVGAGEKKATEDAIEANGGKGSLEAPIAAGAWAKFEKGNLRATRLIRPATAMVEDFNYFNDEPAVGSEFVLVWFEAECGEEKCNAQLDLKLRLVDSKGKEWSEPILMVLDNNLDNQEALRGATMSGWQVFEVAVDEPIQAIWMKWGSETLYALPPAAE